jgi:hypothetical protein
VETSVDEKKVVPVHKLELEMSLVAIDRKSVV